MTNPEPLQRLIQSLRRMAQPPGAERLSDAELLERFLARRDQAAFELLLWRHGPMVLGLCRRALPNPPDAEDAFQATWLAFVRKARSIARGAAVGSWLYRVAYRVALRARAGLVRRSRLEQPDLGRLGTVPGSLPAGTEELGWVLDEEVNRLPARHREAFVLCCLEGLTGEEAARQLGCPPGTVSSRLTRARQRLRSRLARRGLAPSVAGWAAALTADASVTPLPASLVASTWKASLWFSAGKVAGGVLSPQVVSLAEGVLRAMFLTKIKVAGVLFLLAGVLAAGGVLTYRPLRAAALQGAVEDSRPSLTPAPASLKIPRELLEKRRDAARKVFNHTLEMFLAGRATLEGLAAWSKRWLEAELALSDKEPDRTAALKAHLGRLWEVERLTVAKSRVGVLGPETAEAATYYRVEAEIWLFRATGKRPPPPPPLPAEEKPFSLPPDTRTR
jgi:RNA polymerase sigma factor (sigma-70 family)